MNMTKKFAVLALAGTLALGLGACGATTDGTTDPSISQGSELTKTLDIAKAIKTIQDTVPNLPMAVELTSDDFEIYLPGLSVDSVEAFGGLMPFIQSTTEIVIIKVNDENRESVKSTLEARQALQIEIFSQYLPDQYEIVKASKIVEVGEYIYFISAEEATMKLMEDIIIDSFY